MMSGARQTVAIPSHPLAGATVIVTRPRENAATLKRNVARLGGSAVGLPGMGLRVAPDPAAARAALRAARQADITIFISPTAVRYAYQLLPDLRFGRATRLCAVGAGTARALARRGVRDVLWPQQQDSEGLLTLDLLTRVQGLRVALIGAPGGRDLLPASLQQRGAMLQSIHVYQRAAPRLTRRHFVALENATSPLLTLLSSAEILVNLQTLVPAELFLRLAAGEGICSSLRLAQAARAAGFARVHIAASAGMTDMLAAAINALARHRL